ncbi:MAG: membrane-bound PQQ-dependent dehydrogenase, glucose/quinate/shikimate family [Sphingomonadales bacterium]
MPEDRVNASAKNTFGRIHAALLAISAVAYGVGGVPLALAGGSAYYLLAGVVLMIAAVLLWRGSRWGVWALGGLVGISFIWTLAETGIDPWGMVPRLGFLVFLWAILLIPAFRRGLSGGPVLSPLAARAVTLALLALIGVSATVGAVNYGWEGSGEATPLLASYASGQRENGDWIHYGNSDAGTRYSALDQITPENVGRLEVAWTYSIGDENPDGVQATPLKVDDLVYVCSSRNRIVALDAETGEERWVFDPEVDLTGVPFKSCRGVGYYRVPGGEGACAARIYTNTVDTRLIAVDARTGQRCAGFGDNGEISMLEGLGDVPPGYYFYNSAPTVARDKVVLGGMVIDNQHWGQASGVIRAIDAVTGELAWAYDVGRPDRTGAPEPGETYTQSTPNSWAQMAYDDELGMVYVATGNSTPDYFGAQRRDFDEEITSAVIALDIETGRRHWVFRTVYHDVWDYDLASQPVLTDLPGANGVLPILIQPTKRGDLFVLDRRTGEPVKGIEERSVPQAGAAPEERLSPVQPFPVGIASLAGERLGETSMWGLTPFDQMWCRLRFREARYEGPFTPPGVTPGIQYPGYLGGMNWGSATVDEQYGVLVTVTNYMANHVRLVPRAEAEAEGAVPMGPERPGIQAFIGINAQYGTPYGVRTKVFMSPLGVPCQQPPWSRLSAVDLASGELLWSQPLGTGQETGPLGIRSRVPVNVGVPSIGGAITTAGGLTFVGASVDRTFRAFESSTGRLLWSARLPSSANATPSTYRSERSGRQFVVVAAGGHRSMPMGAKGVDDIVAFALPKE